MKCNVEVRSMLKDKSDVNQSIALLIEVMSAANTTTLNPQLTEGGTETHF